MSSSHDAELRIGIILVPNFTFNALANFVDVLRLAADAADGSRPIRCQWQVMSPDPAPIAASCGIAVTPTSGLAEPESLDYIALVGGLLYRGRMIDGRVGRYLQNAATIGIPLIGICTGTFALCRLGLMSNRRCCVSWFHHGDFCQEFTDVNPEAEEQFVVDGQRLTTAGGVGAAYLAASIIENHLGRPTAQKALRIMQLEPLSATPQPSLWQAGRNIDQRIARALHLMEQHINEPMPIAELAAEVKTTKRTLERLFKLRFGRSPKQVYLSMRLTRARRLLRRGTAAASAASDAGFSSAARLAATYKRYFGHVLSDVAASDLGAREAADYTAPQSNQPLRVAPAGLVEYESVFGSDPSAS
jgi:transcriptional regulator GlxA family with amidase domain